jgi:hypothetical protein
MSEGKFGVYEAISKITGALASDGGIKKDRQGAGLNYKFRGIDDAYNALAPLLAEHSLVVLPRIIERQHEERQTKSGSSMNWVTVTAEFDLVSAVDGSSHTVRTYGEAMDTSDKATNKAMSAAYKTMAFMAFAIPVKGDNDTENSHHEPEPKKPKPERPAPRASSRPPAKATPDAAPEGGQFPDYIHGDVSTEDLFSEAKVKRLLAIGGKLFNLTGDALEARIIEAANKILKSNVSNLYALHWRDGGQVMKQLEEQAIKRGVWESRA